MKGDCRWFESILRDQLNTIIEMKKLIIFDLDDTLAESKSTVTLEMAELLEELLKKYHVAVISGGSYSQFQVQFLGSLPLLDNLLSKLYLFPTCATSFYKYDNKKWNQIYSEELNSEEKKKIYQAFETCFKQVGFMVPAVPQHGPILEDRGTQITFSALGQKAPLHLKKKWDPKHIKRLGMVEILSQLLIGYSVRIGGSTSIDITNKNIDKSYSIPKIKEHLGFILEDCLFIGDALFDGGNDAPMKRAGMQCIETSGPAETMKIIRELL